MSKRNPLGLGPDWANLNPEELKMWKKRGYFLALLGMFILVQAIPTIQLGLKLAGGLIFGIGANLVMTANKFEKNA